MPIATVPALRSRIDRILIFLSTVFLGAGLSLGWNPLEWTSGFQVAGILLAGAGTFGLWRFPKDIIDNQRPTL